MFWFVLIAIAIAAAVKFGMRFTVSSYAESSHPGDSAVFGLVIALLVAGSMLFAWWIGKL